ncbi:MAG: ferredoxin [Deltaproteobacteria bacterium]|nr:ferredoxin [Deltaproteobacteria bacterium]
MALKVVVDYDLCEANARCMEACPEVFRVDDDDKLHVLIERPPEALRAKLEEAARICPRQAITIVEE